MIQLEVKMFPFALFQQLPMPQDNTAQPKEVLHATLMSCIKKEPDQISVDASKESEE